VNDRSEGFFGEEIVSESAICLVDLLKAEVRELPQLSQSILF
jgi:hypothetical protein